MKLGDDVMKILSKTYEPLTMVEAKIRRHDLAFKTDAEGRPVLLFMGKKNEDGNIRGDRYGRVLKFADDGSVLKDHWERKGTATP